MAQEQNIDVQIWEYIDGSCSAAEKQRVADLIARDEAWAETYRELSALHLSLAEAAETEQPSLRFTKNVMEQVERTQMAPTIKKYINPIVVKGIAAVFVAGVITAFAYAVHTGSADHTQVSSHSYTMPDININYTVLFSGPVFNAIVMVNIILALLLIDKLLRRKKSLPTNASN